MSKHKLQKLPKYDKLLSVKISGTNLVEVLEIVESCLKNNIQIFISTPNPEIVLLAQKDKKLLEALNSSDIAIPDGVGLLWAAKKMKIGTKLQRIPGRILMEELIKLANRKKYKVFLLGGSEEVNKLAKERIKSQYSGINVAGTGKVKVDIEGKVDSVKNLTKLTSSINSFKPHLLFVAFGAPKQEKWIANNLKNLDVGVVMTVGGSLDYFSRKKLVPPSIVTRGGLEWLWRLLTEKGHYKRVFNAVVVFPLVVLKKYYSSSR